MPNKEDLIRDITIVTTASSKYNMSEADQTGKMIQYFEAKQVFKTRIGTKYLERLREIKMGKKGLGCFVCKTNSAYDGILCESCMKKFTRGEKDFYEKDDFKKLSDIFENEQTVKELKVKPVNFNDPDKAKTTVKNDDHIYVNNVQPRKTEPRNVERRKSIARVLGFAWLGLLLIIWIITSIISHKKVSDGDIRKYIGENYEDVRFEYKMKIIIAVDNYTYQLVGGNTPLNFMIDKPSKTVCGAYINVNKNGYEKHNLLGLKIGDSFEKVKEKLSKTSGVEHLYASNNKLTIRATYDDEYEITVQFGTDGIAKVLGVMTIRPGITELWF